MLGEAIIAKMVTFTTLEPVMTRVALATLAILILEPKNN